MSAQESCMRACALAMSWNKHVTSCNYWCSSMQVSKVPCQDRFHLASAGGQVRVALVCVRLHCGSVQSFAKRRCAFTTMNSQSCMLTTYRVRVWNLVQKLNCCFTCFLMLFVVPGWNTAWLCWSCWTGTEQKRTTISMSQLSWSTGAQYIRVILPLSMLKWATCLFNDSLTDRTHD